MQFKNYPITPFIYILLLILKILLFLNISPIIIFYKCLFKNRKELDIL